MWDFLKNPVKQNKIVRNNFSDDGDDDGEAENVVDTVLKETSENNDGWNFEGFERDEKNNTNSSLITSDVDTVVYDVKSARNIVNVDETRPKALNAPSVSSLAAYNLNKTFGRRRVVNDVSLHVEPGEVVGLLGANGAGKTTTFYMICGLENTEGGKIFLADRDVTKLPLYLRARLGLGYLPQEPSIFRRMTASQNILAVLEKTGLTRRERLGRLEELLEEFSITHIRHTRGDALSGGERRRTEIARCLATDPQFILLDEPFAGIDPKAVDDIQDLIKHLKGRGIGILITDHNVRETLGVTDRAYIMAEGKIFRTGQPMQLVNDSEVRRLYLGDRFTM